MEDPTLTAKADKYKNQGNDEFKKGNFQAAITLYGEAIGKYINFNFLTF